MKKQINETLVTNPAELASEVDRQRIAVLGDKPALDATARLRAAKAPRNGSAVLRALLDVGQKHGLDGRSSISLAVIEKSLTEAAAFEKLERAASTLLTNTRDRVLVAESTAWSMGLKLYGLMQGMAAADPTFALELAPIAKEFARRRRGAKKPKPNPSGAPTPSPAI